MKTTRSLKAEFLGDLQVVVLDEIHRFARWRMLAKGLFDKFREHLVDFVVLKDKKPLFAVECKTGEKHISPHLRYFRDRTNILKFYQVHLGQKKYPEGNLEVLPFGEFCKKEGLP